MASISKRTQARNEKALQDLIRTVPGNDRCADCGARNPGWASWSLGIFLCMRCASLHRKLGTHISKVKSLSMDSWSNEQVDNMKQIGNTKSNKTFNPQNVKPSIPLDVDEVDPMFEKYIRQKYDQQSFINGNARPAQNNGTGSTRSSEDDRAALPPKPTKRFGFNLRSASASIPGIRSQPSSPAQSPQTTSSGWGQGAAARANKPSRVFGTHVGGGGDVTEDKLKQLRDMGFPDDGRNAQVLKTLDGNIERTIEYLARSGDRSGSSSREKTPMQLRAQSESENAVPAATGIGISFGDALPVSSAQAIASTQPTNQPAPAPASHPAARSLGQSQAQSYNPFDPANDQHARMASLDNAFGNMQVSSQHSLFPNATGGYPVPMAPMPDGRYQSMTPPAPQVNSQFFASNPFGSQVAASSSPNPHNPFLRAQGQPQHSIAWNPQSPLQQSVSAFDMGSAAHTPQLQQQLQQQQIHHAAPTGALSSPQLAFPTHSQPTSPSTHQLQNFSPFVVQGSFAQASPQLQYPQHQSPTIPQSQQQQGFAPLHHALTDPIPSSSSYTGQQIHNVGAAVPPSQTMAGPYPTTNTTQQPLQVQQTGRIDKSSILALYNYPHLAPQPQPPSGSANGAAAAADSAAHPYAYANASVNMNGARQGQRSVTMPVSSSGGISSSAAASASPLVAGMGAAAGVGAGAGAGSGSRNPFHAPTANAGVQSAPTAVVGAGVHTSRESADFAASSGLQSGRHSPDAFASLSARHMI